MRPSITRLLTASLALVSGCSAVAVQVDSTILVIARDAASAQSGWSGLQGYGIPYQVLTVPATGVALPALNSTATKGNFGGIVLLSEVIYEKSGSYLSALTTEQFQILYAYQEAFGVRMVRIDVFPSTEHGCVAINGNGNDEPIYFTNTTSFPTANLKTGPLADMTTAGIYHYPATIASPSNTWEIARFSNVGTAAVINKFGNRQQMVFFLPFATDWSATSTFLQHAWIHFLTRGLYSGYRRIYFSTQVDDVHLSTLTYDRQVTYRIGPSDMDGHKAWIPQIQAKMPAGSVYFPELAHNGNGEIQYSIANDTAGLCNPASVISYSAPATTTLEFQKAIGSGADVWPANGPTTYPWSAACSNLDALRRWFNTTANRDTFAHLSHTFTHLSLNNVTFADAVKEIQFNKAWMNQIGIDQAARFSAGGLVPPAITGMHNGDAIRAWMNNGIRFVVGDNTRPVLMNPTSSFWPLVSTVSGNGFAGLVIIPRWATTIYYNCDTPDCTFQEWQDTSAGTGDFQNLLKDARSTNGRHLLGLHWDPYMFHQANLRYSDMPNTVVNGVAQKMSLMMIWVETMVNEMTRLVDWPMVTIKHDDMGGRFMNRMTRDNCAPKMAWTTNADVSQISSITVAANNNRCSVDIPITVPAGTFTTTAGVSSFEKLGSDPLTNWVTLSGQARSYTLTSPVAV